MKREDESKGNAGTYLKNLLLRVVGLYRTNARSLKMKRCVSALLLLVGAIFLWASPVISGQLNTKKVLSAVYERLMKEKKIEHLKMEHLSLQKIIPIKIGNMNLWAVRVEIILAPPNKSAQTATADFVTDDNGEWEFESISELKTGYPLLEKALADLAKENIDPNIGQVIFRGQGEKTVVVVIDNFCSYCREVYRQLPGVYEKQIKELDLIYLPLNSHPGAEMASAVSLYVHNQKNLEQHAREVDNFIFQELPAPATKDIKEANTTVYEALKEKFPWLAGEFSGMEMEDVWKKLRAGSNISEQIKYAVNLGTHGTPVIFVDGRKIEGADWTKFARFLSY
jgi:protein-disulfide isomerase